MNESNDGHPSRNARPILDAMSAAGSPVLTAFVIVLAVIGAVAVLGVAGMAVVHFAMMGGIGRTGVC